MADEHDKGPVRHEVAAVVQQTTGGDSGQFMTRYVNMVAWWPVVITLLILSSNVGVWFYFLGKDLETTYFMGFEDYAATTVLGAIPFLSFAALLFVLVSFLAILLLPLTAIRKGGVSASRGYETASAIAAFILLSGFAIMSVWRIVYKTLTDEDVIFLAGYAVAGIFLLSMILRVFGGAVRRLSFLVQVFGILIAPGVSAYMYFKWIHTTGTPLSVNMEAIAGDSENSRLVAQCREENDLIWMGSKALVIACGPRTDEDGKEVKREHLIITNPQGEHVSRHAVRTVAVTGAEAPVIQLAPATTPVSAKPMEKQAEVAPAKPAPQRRDAPAETPSQKGKAENMLNVIARSVDLTGGEGPGAQASSHRIQGRDSRKDAGDSELVRQAGTVEKTTKGSSRELPKVDVKTARSSSESASASASPIDSDALKESGKVRQGN